MSKQIKDYPKWVQEKAIARMREQEMEVSTKYIIYQAFEMGNTAEGFDIWEDAANDKLQSLADFHGIKIDENGEEVVEMPIISQDSKIEQKQNIKDAYNQGYRDGFLDAQSESIGGKDIAEFDNAENYYNEHFKTK